MKLKLKSPHHSPFAGNGLSRTAMLYKIATLAGRKLTPVELNQIKNINPGGLKACIMKSSKLTTKVKRHSPCNSY